MTTKIGLALCALAVAVPAWMGIQAGETAPAATTGRVLVLDNERTLEGDVERIGEQYRVRRALGELWVQRENVLRLCKDYPEAYGYLRNRANLRDPDEHLRLARWCQLHSLRDEALKEVTEAADLRPQHADTQRLLRNLQRAATMARADKSAQPNADSEPGPNPPPVTTESLSGYVVRVQPLLMNTCAGCHATGRGGAFKLTRTYENSLVSRKTTLQNLSAVLARVNPEQVQASPLLIKAVSVHGDMAQPALKSRDTAAFRTLEQWVRTTVEGSPQLRDQPAQTVAGSVSSGVTNSEPRGRSSNPAPPQGMLADGKEVGKPSPTKQPPGPADPFDPQIFNRQLHPEKTEGK